MAYKRWRKQKPEPPPLETRNEVFALASVGGDSNLKLAAERIRKMSAEERRDLRAACQTLDELLDDVFLAESRERRPWKL